MQGLCIAGADDALQQVSQGGLDGSFQFRFGFDRIRQQSAETGLQLCGLHQVLYALAVSGELGFQLFQGVQARGGPVQLIPPRLPGFFLLRQALLQIVLVAAQPGQLDLAGLLLACGRSQLTIQLGCPPPRQCQAFGQLDPFAAVTFQAFCHTGQALAGILLAAFELGRFGQCLKQFLAATFQQSLQLIFTLLLSGQVGLRPQQVICHVGGFYCRCVAPQLQQFPLRCALLQALVQLAGLRFQPRQAPLQAGQFLALKLQPVLGGAELTPDAVDLLLGGRQQLFRFQQPQAGLFHPRLAQSRRRKIPRGFDH